MSCGVGRRHSLDPALLWLWCRLVAIAPIRPLAWEPPYAALEALKKDKKKTKTKNQKKLSFIESIIFVPKMIHFPHDQLWNDHTQRRQQFHQKCCILPQRHKSVIVATVSQWICCFGLTQFMNSDTMTRLTYSDFYIRIHVSKVHSSSFFKKTQTYDNVGFFVVAF